MSILCQGLVKTLQDYYRDTTTSYAAPKVSNCVGVVRFGHLLHNQGLFQNCLGNVSGSFHGFVAI